jgi:hypothetical protein
MASNKELAEQATALAVELGITVETEGLKNAALHELVAELQTRLGRSPAAAASEAPSDAGGPPEPPAGEGTPPPPAKPKRAPVDGARGSDAGGPPEPPKPPAPKLRHPYQVAPGKSLTTLRGVLGPGDEMRATDCADGVEQLERLVAGGYLLKRP